MTRQARVLSRGRRNAALVFGSVFLLGAAAVLLYYVASFGLDASSGYGLAVIVLVAVMLCTGASSTPRQWKFMRIVASLLCLVSVLVLAILGAAARSSDPSGHAGTLLFVTGVLLIPVAPWVVAIGKPGPGIGDGSVAVGRRSEVVYKR
jgi:hypothetical protein